MKIWCVAAWCLLVGAGCAPEIDFDDRTYFPADFEETYTMVSPCSESVTHGGNYVQVYASPDALEAFTDPTKEYPVGAILVKSQHRETAPECDYPTKWTVMRKGEEGSAPESNDWGWQQIDGDGAFVLGPQPNGCVTCHAGCGEDRVCTNDE